MVSRKRKLTMMIVHDEIHARRHNSIIQFLPKPEKFTILLEVLTVGLFYREQHFRMPGFFELWIDRYLETDFFMHFRMTMSTKNRLVSVIAPVYFKLCCDRQRGLQPVPYEKCVLMTLWYLSKGETLLTTGDRFDVATATVYRIVNNVISCIVELLPRYIVWPKRQECETVSEQFFQCGHYPGVIGAIDGCHVTCKIPVQQHDSYQDRKFNHSITLQGICTATRIFTDVSVGWPGSIHDARILKESALGRNIEMHGPLNYFYGPNYHLVGDSAYPLKTWLMAPYRDNGRLTALQKKHNQTLSKTRVTIENVFGLLKGRWRILQYVNIRTSIERAINIITACCVLHNFCLINNDDFDDFEQVSDEDLNYSVANMNIPEIAGSIKRDEIASSL